MYFTKMFKEESGYLSYLIGCIYEGTACVVNPKRDVLDYPAIAKNIGMKITHIFDTRKPEESHLNGIMERILRKGSKICYLNGRLRFAILSACVVLLCGLTVFVVEEASILASQTIENPIDTFDRDDKCPNYNRGALEETKEKKMKVEMKMIEDIKKDDKTETYDTMDASLGRFLLLISPVPMLPF